MSVRTAAVMLNDWSKCNNNTGNAIAAACSENQTMHKIFTRHAGVSTHPTRYAWSQNATHIKTNIFKHKMQQNEHWHTTENIMQVENGLLATNPSDPRITFDSYFGSLEAEICFRLS